MIDNQKSLVISGFDWSVPEQELRRLLEQVGTVEKFAIKKQPNGQPIAHATMHSENEASDVILKFDGTLYRGIVLKAEKTQSHRLDENSRADTRPNSSES